MNRNTDELCSLRSRLDAELRKPEPDTIWIDQTVDRILFLENRDVTVSREEIRSRYRHFRSAHPAETKPDIASYTRIAACIIINLAILALTLLEHLS